MTKQPWTYYKIWKHFAFRLSRSSDGVWYSGNTQYQWFALFFSFNKAVSTKSNNFTLLIGPWMLRLYWPKN